MYGKFFELREGDETEQQSETTDAESDNQQRTSVDAAKFDARNVWQHQARLAPGACRRSRRLPVGWRLHGEDRARRRGDRTQDQEQQHRDGKPAREFPYSRAHVTSLARLRKQTGCTRANRRRSPTRTVAFFVLVGQTVSYQHCGPRRLSHKGSDYTRKSRGASVWPTLL